VVRRWWQRWPGRGGRGAAWGADTRAALAYEAEQVAAAREGTRNRTLNTAAFSLGQLAAAGLLEVDQVRARLLAIAIQAGNPEGKARATIESGLRDGARTPRRRSEGGTP